MDFFNSNNSINNKNSVLNDDDNVNLLENQQEKISMLPEQEAANALDSGIDLSKMISFENEEPNLPQNIETKKEENPFIQQTSNEANPFANNNYLNDLTNKGSNLDDGQKNSFDQDSSELLTQNEIIKDETVEADSLKNENTQKEESFLQSTDNDRIYQIEVQKIVPNPYQPRRDFNNEAINELASSIQEYGVLEPLIVKRIEKEQQNGLNVEYQLIAGERRFRASKLIGLKTVPAIIRNFDNKCLELEVALVENVQREDLSPVMKARAYAQLINEFGYTQEMVGRRISKSREAVANVLRLLQLPFEAQKALDESKISESHARALLLLPNMEKQRALLGEILSKQLSSREAEIIARQFLDKQGIKTTVSGRKRKGDSFDPKDLELREKLEEMFGSKVTIKRKGEMGEISIHFYSNDELDGLVGKLTNSSEKMINKTVDKLNNI